MKSVKLNDQVKESFSASEFKKYMSQENTGQKDNEISSARFNFAYKDLKLKLSGNKECHQNQQNNQSNSQNMTCDVQQQQEYINKLENFIQELTEQFHEQQKEIQQLKNDYQNQIEILKQQNQYYQNKLNDQKYKFDVNQSCQSAIPRCVSKGKNRRSSLFSKSNKAQKILNQSKENCPNISIINNDQSMLIDNTAVNSFNLQLQINKQTKFIQSIQSLVSQCVGKPQVSLKECWGFIKTLVNKYVDYKELEKEFLEQQKAIQNILRIECSENIVQCIESLVQENWQMQQMLQ